MNLKLPRTVKDGGRGDPLPLHKALLEESEETSDKETARLSWTSLLVMVTLLVLLATSSSIAVFLLPRSSLLSQPSCLSTCSVQLVESLPEGLVYNTSVPGTVSTYSAWSQLISLAREQVHLAGMYWTLRGQDIHPHPSAWEGEDVFKRLKEVSISRSLSLKIAQNKPRPGEPNLDTEELARDVPGAEVRDLDFSRLMGAGVLHTKLWVVDNKHFYVGSANFDWRSLTQVKELGVLVTDCPCLAEDMSKIWSVYWALGDRDSVPPSWPDTLATNINSAAPLTLSGSDLSVYLSSSPPPFCPEGREQDLAAIIKTIDSAEQFVDIAVMDYFPTTIYTPHPQFWPPIDDALRRAAISRGVSVRLLVSHWAHTRPSMTRYLASLASLAGDSGPKVDIRVKMFTVPSFSPDQADIPFARVNHNKYMVTDKTGYIGTSNWSGDYFISTGGVGFVFQGSMRAGLVEVFNRDWSSKYAKDI